MSDPTVDAMFRDFAATTLTTVTSLQLIEGVLQAIPPGSTDAQLGAGAVVLAEALDRLVSVAGRIALLLRPAQGGEA